MPSPPNRFLGNQCLVENDTKTDTVKEKVFSCEQCGEQSKRRRELRKHIKSVHDRKEEETPEMERASKGTANIGERTDNKERGNLHKDGGEANEGIEAARDVSAMNVSAMTNQMREKIRKQLKFTQNNVRTRLRREVI